jgi:hypothetical protein
MAVQNFVHFGVCVSDPERSMSFYCDLLGFPDSGWSASLDGYLTECLVSVVRKTDLISPTPAKIGLGARPQRVAVPQVIGHRVAPPDAERLRLAGIPRRHVADRDLPVLRHLNAFIAFFVAGFA